MFVGAEVLWQHKVVQFQRDPLVTRKEQLALLVHGGEVLLCGIAQRGKVSLGPPRVREDAVYLHTLGPHQAHVCARHPVRENVTCLRCGTRRSNRECRSSRRGSGANQWRPCQCRAPAVLRADWSKTSSVAAWYRQFGPECNFCACGPQILHRMLSGRSLTCTPKRC